MLCCTVYGGIKRARFSRSLLPSRNVCGFLLANQFCAACSLLHCHRHRLWTAALLPPIHHEHPSNLKILCNNNNGFCEHQSLFVSNNNRFCRICFSIFISAFSFSFSFSHERIRLKCKWISPKGLLWLESKFKMRLHPIQLDERFMLNDTMTSKTKMVDYTMDSCRRRGFPFGSVRSMASGSIQKIRRVPIFLYLSVVENGDAKRIASFGFGSIYSIFAYWLGCGDVKHTICCYFIPLFSFVYFIFAKVFSGCIGCLPECTVCVSWKQRCDKRDFPYHWIFRFRFLLNIYLDFVATLMDWNQTNELHMLSGCSASAASVIIYKIVIKNAVLILKNIQIN